MRIAIGIAAMAMVAATSAVAQVHVEGHVRKDGTYVPPHVRSAPNSSRSDNWSTQGNYNPYTGQQGTQNPTPQWNQQRQQQQVQPRVPGRVKCPQGAVFC